MFDASKIDWKEIEAFFYRAMLEGWATGAKIPMTATCHKEVTYGDPLSGPYVLQDRWTKTPGSDFSSGVTTIYRTEAISADPWIPVWVMHYGGWYTKDGSAVVRQCLREAYAGYTKESAPFRGCRGFCLRVIDDFCYTNDVVIPGSFRFFSGHERVGRIVRDARVDCGFHRYFGMALI